MPSDRTPSQAEIEAAKEALREKFPGWNLDEIVDVALSAAATARPDCEQCEFLRESNKAYRQSRQESWDIAEKWQAIARGLYEATSDIVDQIRDSPGTISLTGIDVRLWTSLTQYEKALRDLGSASLGEGEGGRCS